MYRPLGNRQWQDLDALEEEEGDEAAHRLLLAQDDIRLTIKNSQPTTEYIYYTLQPGDTLHNISVRFSCPLATIKRLNNLWSDQDFYGFTKLKLPVGKFRLLADLIEPAKTTQQVTAGPSTSNRPIIPTTTTATTTSTAFLHHPPIGSNNEQGGDKIFKDVDTNIESARRAACSYKNNANEIMQSLAQSGNLVADETDDANYRRQLDPNRIAQREAETLLNDMTDYGLSYNGLILFVFIVCLICPLAYVIYLEETHHESTASTTTTNKHYDDQL